jgi:hypothetical protein
LKRVPLEAFVRATGHAVDFFGKALIQMVVDDRSDEIEHALIAHFGVRYQEYIEIKRMPLASKGRAENWETTAQNTALTWCGYLNSPVVRYDGGVLACCNENVIRRIGPQRLRVECQSAEDVTRALEKHLSDPLNRTIAALGPAFAARHSQFGCTSIEANEPICTACWKMQNAATKSLYLSKSNGVA